MRSIRPTSELGFDNPSRVVNKTVLDDLSRIQRVICAISTWFAILTFGSLNPSFPLVFLKSVGLISYVIVLLLLFVNPKRHFRVLTSNKLLLVLIAFVTFSTFWSSNPWGTVLLLRRLIQSYLFAVCLVSIYSVRTQLRLFQYALIAGGIASAFLALLIPEMGTHYVNGTLSLRGIYSHKQYLGMFMLVCSSTFIPFIVKSKTKIEFYLSCLGILFCSIALYFTNSKISIIAFLAFIVSVPFYVLYTYNLGQKIRSLFLIISGLVALVLIAVVISNYETILVDILRKGTNLNGRVPLWSLCLQEGMQRPIFGYGYGGFWASDVGISVAYRSWVIGALYDPLYWNPGQLFVWHAHNGLIEIFLNLGIVGLTLTLLNVGHSVGKIFANLRINQSVSYYSTELHWMFLVILLLFIVNSTEPYLLASRDLLWTVYMCIALNLSSRRV